MSGVIKMDIRRAFFNLRFLFCAAAVCGLWYMNAKRFWHSSGDVLSIFFYGTGLTNTGSISLVVVNAVFGLSVNEDMNDHAIWNTASRISLKKYVFSKLLVCMVASCITYILGTGLYLCWTALYLPLVLGAGDMVLNLKELTAFSVWLPSHTAAFILLQTICTGLACSGMSAVSIGISAFVKDSFITLCLPLILYYLFFYILFDGIRSDVTMDMVYFMMSTGSSIAGFLCRLLLVTAGFAAVGGGLLYWGMRRNYQYA